MRCLYLVMALGLFSGVAAASDDEARRLTLEICAAPDAGAMAGLAFTAEEAGSLNPLQVAGVFGVVDFLAERRLCGSRQAVRAAYTSFAAGRPDRDAVVVAFTRARLLARAPRGLTTVGADRFAGSFLALAQTARPAVPH